MRIAKIFITLLLIFLVACKDEIVARGVDQKQANEIVSIFARENINSKVVNDKNSKKLLMILVDKENFNKAATILTTKSLPREKGASFSDVIGHHGILPDSKKMENLRLDKALALEIEDNILKIDGISQASVVVRKESLEDEKEPMVSVLLIKKPNASFLNVDNIIRIIKTAIPGVKDKNINVLEELGEGLDEANNIGILLNDDDSKLVKLNKFLGKFNVASEEIGRLNILFASLMIISFLLGISFTSLYIKYKNIKKEKAKIMEFSPNDLL